MIRGGTIGILAGIVIALAIIVFATPKPDLVPDPEALSTYKDDLKEEAHRLAASGGLARREGQLLVVSYGRKDVASFKNTHPYTCWSNDPCQQWTLWSVLSLKASPEAKPETLVVLGFVPYVDAPTPAIVDKDGHLIWMQEQILPQDGGRYLTSASLQGVHTGAHFTIIDWASPGHRTAWEAPFGCDALTWLADGNLVVGCDFGSQNGRLASAIVHREGGTWTITENGAFTGDNIHKAQLREPYVIAPVAHSLRKFTMSKVTFDPVRAARGSHFGDNPKDPQSGYKRLVWP